MSHKITRISSLIRGKLNLTPKRPYSITVAPKKEKKVHQKLILNYKIRNLIRRYKRRGLGQILSQDPTQQKQMKIRMRRTRKLKRRQVLKYYKLCLILNISPITSSNSTFRGCFGILRMSRFKN